MSLDRCRHCGGAPCACAHQQAFPVPATKHNYAESGMTMLDYFAGQALAGFIVVGDELPPSYEHAAMRAYDIAAAMIAERSPDALGLNRRTA